MKSHRVAVTVDIEDWYHIPSVCGSPFSAYRDVNCFFEDWNEEYDYLTEPTARVLDLLDRYHVTATFFVVADVLDHYPGVVEAIADRGHEIACHGLHHMCKLDPKSKAPLMGADEFIERTRRAKKELESVSGERVIGYRAPNALISGWMLDALEKCGFVYDSSVSVNSLYNKTDSSLAGVSSCPYYPRKGELLAGDERNLIEYPWAFWDAWGLKIPTCGGPMLRFIGARMILSGLMQCLERGDTVFYFHPIDISEGEFPSIGRGRPLYWMVKGDLVLQRIEYVLRRLSDRGVEMGTAKDILGCA
jgi:peptidoglycan-N-acetylglucosamine deacetylase